MSNKDGGPAFPQETAYVYGNQQVMSKGPQGGMTLRDYFAAKAMQGEIVSQGLEGRYPPHIARMAYEMADAMLKARSQQ